MTMQQLKEAYLEMEAHIADGHCASHTIDWLHDKQTALAAEEVAEHEENARQVAEKAHQEHKTRLESRPNMEDLSSEQKPDLADTHAHHAMHDRPDLKDAPVGEEKPDLFKEHPYEGSAS